MTRLPLHDWCEALGISQAAISRRCGIPQPVLSDYAHGKRNPTIKTLDSIGKSLGVEAWELLRGPLPGQGLPTEEESRAANIEWFKRLSPSQKERVLQLDREFIRRARGEHEVERSQT